MNTTLKQHQDQAMDDAQKMARLNIHLDACGIGHNLNQRIDVQFASISEFVSDVAKRAFAQAVYNATRNAPVGIMRHADCTGKKAIRQSIPGAIGQLVEWDIRQAIDIAADILEEVNAHNEAAKVREMKL